MKIKKNDFIEIEFVAKTAQGDVFDSNKKEQLEKLHAGHNHSIEPKPFVMCVGQDMFLKGVEDYLIGKEIGKYTIELSPEKAFGKRNPKLVQVISRGFFKKNNVDPVPGHLMNFDGRVGRVMTVTGGRVTVDFNNPLAGRVVIYELEVKRFINDKDKKLKAFINFIFRKDIDFKVIDKKLELIVDKEMRNFAEMFKEKFKEIFNLDLILKEKEPTKKLEEKIEK